MMGADTQLNLEQIAKFSKKDAEAYPKYEADARTRRHGHRADA